MSTNQRLVLTSRDQERFADLVNTIVDIGDWVFRQATDQVKKWKTTFCGDFQISVNTSPIQYESRIEVSFSQYLRDKNVDGRNTGIEMTEYLFMTSNDQVLDTLLNLRDAGIQVSLDDFGTGYSSLAARTGSVSACKAKPIVSKNAMALNFESCFVIVPDSCKKLVTV